MGQCVSPCFEWVVQALYILVWLIWQRLMVEIGPEWRWLADLTANKLENKQSSRLDLPSQENRNMVQVARYICSHTGDKGRTENCRLDLSFTKKLIG